MTSVPPTSCMVDHPSRYLRALAAMYIRMTFRAAEVYEILEPLMKDFRKIRYRNQSASFFALSVLLCSPHTDGYHLTYMDEFVDSLLTEERVCDIILPRITKRDVLEDNGEIGPRKSRLLDAMEGKDETGSERSRSTSRSPSRSRSRSPSRARSRSRSVSSHKTGSRSPSQAGSRYVSRSRSRSRSGSRYRSRSRSISPDRLNGSADRFRSRSRSISPDRMETGPG